MKLVRCYISSFGKLNDFSYDFNEKLNVIKQDNGWGKSTLATFIKAMFYGLNDSKRNVADNERTKFRPWNSTQKFGGYVCFTWKDKEFRLERFFAQKESEDTVRLFDEKTGKEFTNLDNLGKRIFEIDEDGFLSTTYFSQKDFQIKSNTSITDKFNSVVEMQDSFSYDKAITKLEEKAKSYSRTGDRGIIPETKRRIFELESEIKKIENDLDTITKLKQVIALNTTKLTVLEKQNNLLSDEIVKASRLETIAIKKEQYDKNLIKKQELESILSSANEILSGSIVDKNQIEYFENQNQKLITIDANIENINKDILRFSQNTEKPQKDSSKGFKVLGLSLGGIFGIICLILSLTNGFNLLPIIFLVLAGASIIVPFVLPKSNSNKTNSFDEILSIKQNELVELTNQKTQILTEIDSYLSKFKIDTSLDRRSALLTIQKVIEKKCDIEKDLSAVNLELKNIDIKEFENIGLEKVENLDLLKIQLKKGQEEYSILSRETEVKRSDLRYYEDSFNTLCDLESQKEELIVKQKEAEEHLSIIKQTIKFLKLADEKLKIKYKMPLQNSLTKYFNYIDGANRKVNIDIDFNVTIEEYGEQKVKDYYSRGYQNLIDICKRFALVDVLFTGEKPFIILDDPFYNLDENKINLALDLIEKLSNDYQILYLVCHQSRVKGNE